MQTFRILTPALAGIAGWILTTHGQTAFPENFAEDPASTGWRAVGDSTLFQWNEGNENLEVIWNSSTNNSYFLRPLGTILTKHDDFGFAFDLQLQNIAIGTTAGKPFTFQLAVGFIDLDAATRTNFFRGTGMDSPNLVEFDYFPDSGFGATVSPTVISSNMQFATSFNSPLELTTNDWFHVALAYTASNQTLTTVMTRNADNFGPIQSVILGPNFTDFRVDSFAVSSYSDAGQDPQYAGSILAHGVIDNLVVATPGPPVSNLRGNLVNGVWQLEFISRTNWSYALERTENWQSWLPASPNTPGVDGTMVLVDTNASVPKAFYRVRAEIP